jgi:hypothetical protein
LLKHTGGAATEPWGNLQDPDALFDQLYKANENWDPALIDFLKQTPDKVVTGI